MRTKPAIPEPQGKTPMERMDWAFRTVLKVSKADMIKDDERHPKNHSIVEEMDEQYGPLPLSSRQKPAAKHP
jgi:hypothetical protein